MCFKNIVGGVLRSKSRGRPRRRWVQDVESWLKMNINDAAKITVERSTWRTEVHRAACLSGGGAMESMVGT